MNSKHRYQSVTQFRRWSISDLCLGFFAPVRSLAVLFVCLGASLANANGPRQSSPILAYVGERAITEADVNFHLGRLTTGDRPLPELSKVAQQSAIDLIALQRQALQTLRDTGMAASETEIDDWISTTAQKTDPDDPTGKNMVTNISRRFRIQQSDFREFVAFRISWQRYVEKHVNEANMVQHFGNQTARFDGTRFRVHLASVAVPAGQSASRIASAKSLEQFRQRVADSSAAWSATISEVDSTGWEVQSDRWLRGTGDFDPALVDVLLKMEIGQVSPVSHTATGVHVLKLEEMEPGALSIDQVRGEVRTHMLIYLLRFLAKSSQETLPLRSAEK